MNRVAARLGIELHHVQFLRRPADHAPAVPLPGGVRLAEWGVDDTARICTDAHVHGQMRSEARMRARFTHGLRYLVLEHDGDVVAWCWVAAGVPRYIDELCRQVDMAPGQAWVRDAFVAPAQRGRRLLTAMLDAISTHLGGGIEYFSDVEASNQASLRAHLAAGFVACAAVRSAAGTHWRLRPVPPASLPSVDASRPTQRLLWLDARERERHRKLIA
ncbi:GNAT family N-acetyltransferase [Luteimonas aestuarii]|nr:GNAT family N-acetyltransferase [Luteimonas aestuarii]